LTGRWQARQVATQCRTFETMIEPAKSKFNERTGNVIENKEPVKKARWLSFYVFENK
jgi:hypothetical protein